MRHTAVDEDEAVDGADREPGAEDRGDHEHARARVLVDDRTDNARERDRGADGEVDAPRHDHEQLPEGEHRDDRRLGEDVAEVPGRQEDGCRQPDDQDQEDQDQRGAGAKRPEPGLEEPVAVEDAGSARCLRGLAHGHHHSPPTATAASDQTGPFGNAYSSSDSGRISML